jgi:hypothetical protein
VAEPADAAWVSVEGPRARGAGGGAGTSVATTWTSAWLMKPFTPVAPLTVELTTRTEYQSPVFSTASSSAPFSRSRRWNESEAGRL